MVALRRRLQPVQRLRCGIDSCIEAEGHIGSGQVVINRLRHANNLRSHADQLMSNGHRAIAPCHNERINLHFLQAFERVLGSIHYLDGPIRFFDRYGKRAAPIRRAENSAAARQ